MHSRKPAISGEFRSLGEIGSKAFSVSRLGGITGVTNLRRIVEEKRLSIKRKKPWIG